MTKRLPFQWLKHRCVGKGDTSFPGLLHFTHDPYLIMLIIKPGGIKYYFWVFGMTPPGIEPLYHVPLVNIPTTMPMVWSIYHHHHHVVPLARISLTLSRHFSPSFIASGRSSGLHPISSHSCCMHIRAGRLALAYMVSIYISKKNSKWLNKILIYKIINFISLDWGKCLVKNKLQILFR